SDFPANRFQLLRLVRNGALSPGKELRPGAVVKTRGAGCLARQFTWWQLDAQSASLTSQITYEVTGGRLFELRLGLPAGWTVEQVGLLPGNGSALTASKANWTVFQENNRAILKVVPRRLLTAQAPLRLTVRLRAQRPRPGGPFGAVPRGGLLVAF